MLQSAALLTSACGKRFTGCEARLNCPIQEEGGGEGGTTDAETAGTSAGGAAGLSLGGASRNAGTAGSPSENQSEGGVSGKPESAAAGMESESAGTDSTGPESVCEPNEGQCQGNVPRACNAEGTAWIDGDACLSEETCAKGTCEKHQCEPETTFCSGRSVRQCSEDGLSSTELKQCGSSEYCDAATAACKSGVCAPNQPACDNGRATTCNAEGSGYVGRGTPCDTSVSSCEGGQCRPHVCAPGAAFCQGQELKRCSADGLLSAVTKTCSSSEYCDEVTAQCKPLACSPNEQECMGNTLRTCNASGTAWISTNCTSTQFCDSSSKSCKPRVCTPNAKQCSGNGVQTCSSDGSAWGTPIACPDSTPNCQAGACVTPNSCSGIPANCGSSGNESCCLSIGVPGGTFNRSNDSSAPATVSAFRLDKYEVTRGRFRKYMLATLAGWRPTDGAGKHSHLNGGQGLSSTTGGFESGARPEWGEPPSQNWASYNALRCGPEGYIDENPDAATDVLPYHCVDWRNAAALCIWDGGFLPSEAEWNYAAAAGSEQREYPWGSGVASAFVDDTKLRHVGLPMNGSGKWGHANMGGNIDEWVIDAFAAYKTPCKDCAYLTSSVDSGEGVLRGGRYGDLEDGDNSTDVTTAHRTSGRGTGGIRCARSP